MKRAALSVLLLGLVACSQPPQPPETPPASPAGPPSPAASAAAPGAEAAALRSKWGKIFQALPAEAPSQGNELTEARINLGRMLYYEARLSTDGTISCNSCHDLQNYGVDGKPTSSGVKGQLGGRNSPTVYHAALHTTQFWDGRAKDVEEQAKGPVLNPIEMAMPAKEEVEKRLREIPGYRELFAAAFPKDKEPVTFENMALAIGAFERKLMTPSPFDRFLQGDDTALTPEQLRGLQTFGEVGCVTCHTGVAMGGNSFRKLGQVKPYETKDQGRFDVTKNEADKFMFKVQSLRNVEKTGPYFHDGSVATLEDATRLMAEHQLGKTLTDQQVQDLVAFMKSMTGEIPADYIAKPTLPGETASAASPAAGEPPASPAAEPQEGASPAGQD